MAVARTAGASIVPRRRDGRLVGAVLAAVVAAGCGGVGKAGGDVVSVVSSVSVDTRVAWVPDAAGPDGVGLNAAVTAALGRAAGMSVTTLPAPMPDGYSEVLGDAAAKGFPVVVTAGEGMAQAVGVAARRFPGTRFVLVGVSALDPEVGGASNVTGVVADPKQDGYLAGVVAGLLERDSSAPGLSSAAQVVGVVGGSQSAVSEAVVAGFVAGVASVAPKVEVLVVWAHESVQQEPCSGIAMRLVAAGADLLVPYAGGCSGGVVVVAEQAGVRVVTIGAADGIRSVANVATVEPRLGDAAAALVGGLAADAKAVTGSDVVAGVAAGAVRVTVAADAKVDAAAVDAARGALSAGAVSIPDEALVDSVTAVATVTSTTSSP